MRSIDGEIAAIAGRQHGVVSYRQLRELGLDRSAISRRCQSGRLHRIYRQAYAVGHAAISERGRWLAAVLAGGAGALLSHQSAARLYGARIADNGPHISAPRRNLDAIRGVIVHRPRSLRAEDRAELDRIPVTSIARTILDIAPSMSVARLAALIENVERLHRPDWSSALSLARSMSGHPGIGRFRSALKASVDFPEFTRSDLERELIVLCDEAGVQRPSMNVFVDGYEVDAYWPDAGLVIELDSWHYHGTRRAFETDRARDVELQLSGKRVLRFTPRRFTSLRPDSISMLRRLAPRR